MKSTLTSLLFLIQLFCFAQNDSEIDTYFEKLALTVKNGDYSGMCSLYHPEGVLVTKSKTFPISAALESWKPGIDATKKGSAISEVSFRFSKRLENETTAHMTGIFHYWSKDRKGQFTSDDYIHFEMLLVKKDGQWLATMENQKSVASKSEWEAIAP